MNDQANKKGKFAGILTELVEVIADNYHQELRMAADDARRAAELAIESIKAHVGGSAIYFAKGHLWAITERHRAIYKRFTGANHAQLAREFNLTERQIYNIIALVGQEEFEARQGKLFEKD
jgi:Mor family transcriptional regulator